MPLTLEEIRQKGLQALRRELGQAGMIRFLRQFETGKGDYARERREWVDGMSLEQLRQLTESKRKPKKRGAR